MPWSNEARVPQVLSLCSRAQELLSPRTAATEARTPQSLCNRRSHRSEKPEHRKKRRPCSPQPEKACSQQRGPSAARIDKNLNI